MEGMLARWLSSPRFGVGLFSTVRRHLFLHQDGIALVFGTFRSVRRKQVKLQTKGDFLITDRADHKYGFHRKASSQTRRKHSEHEVGSPIIGRLGKKSLAIT